MTASFSDRKANISRESWSRQKTSRLKKWSSNPMPSFCHPPSIFDYCVLSFCVRARGLPAWPKCPWICSRLSIFPWSWWPLFTAACRRSRSKPISPTPSSGSSRWPAASITWNRARMAGVSLIKIYLSAGHRRQCRCDADLESGHGGFASAAARHASASRDEGGRFQPAGLPADRSRTGFGRDATS